MTQKDYIAIARALRNAKPPAENSWRGGAYRAMIEQWVATVDAVADTCKAERAEFDRSKFNTACGLTDGEQVTARDGRREMMAHVPVRARRG